MTESQKITKCAVEGQFFIVLNSTECLDANNEASLKPGFLTVVIIEIVFYDKKFSRSYNSRTIMVWLIVVVVTRRYVNRLTVDFHESSSTAPTIITTSKIAETITAR